MDTRVLTSITATRIILRPHRQSAFEAVHQYSRDPEVVKFMQWGPNSEEQTRDFLSNCIANQSVDQKTTYDFAVDYEGKLIGSISLRLSKPGGKLGEIGYCYDKSTWGKGIASEAAEAIMKFGFEDLGLHKISATCDPYNFGSAKVLQKTGMKLEGYLRKHIEMRGSWRDTLLFGTAREDQEANKKDYRNKQLVAETVKAAPDQANTVLTSAFGDGVVTRCYLKKGETIAPHTQVLDEYYVVLKGTLRTAEAVWSEGSLVHTPLAVKQSLIEAETDAELIVLRLGPAAK